MPVPSKKLGIGLVVFFVVTGLIVGLVFLLDDSNNLDNSTPEPFSVSLRRNAFDPEMLEGYDKCPDFVSDLEEISKYMVNVHVDRMAQQYYHKQYFHGMSRGGDGFMDGGYYVAEMADDASGGPAKTKSNTGEDSYGSNNQVEGVDEADSVKSDGMHVYAAYGDSIVVWNATNGKELSRTIIPTTDDEGTSLCYENSGPNEHCYENYNWQKMSIASLLMHGDRITVIAQSPYVARDQNQSAMYGSRATRIFIYKKVSPDHNGPLTLITQKDINGQYQSARSIGEYAHIVTSSAINAWGNLYEYLNPTEFVPKSKRFTMAYYGNYNDVTGYLTENQYINAALTKAEKLIPSFAQKLAFESLDTTDFSVADCTKIARIALYSKQNDMKIGEEPVRVSFTTASALNNFAQIFSFNMLSATNEGILPISSSGIFVPLNSYSSSVYSSKEKLIIAGEGYEENSEGVWKEKTLLFAFGLDGENSKAESIGVVPGSLLNQFSMDHYNAGDEGTDYLRVATTSWGQWGMVKGEWVQTEESSSQVTVLTLPPLGNETTNNATKMEIVGQASNLGRGERIYAVRFLGTSAFVVTFRQIDPFYTLNMTDPTKPEVVGELKIPGFSNYLHPIGDGNLILAVGQDANEEGRVNGLQIAMYNVTDFANPSQIKKFSKNENGYSSSAAQYDHQAFRYLPETEALILPVYQHGQTYFDGFIVYNVPVQPDEKFGESFKITHVDQSMQKCWSRSTLTARSLVFKGHVTTLKGHTVLSHNLSDKKQQWMLNLDANQDQTKECFYYWN